MAVPHVWCGSGLQVWLRVATGPRMCTVCADVCVLTVHKYSPWWCFIDTHCTSFVSMPSSFGSCLDAT